MDFNTFDMERNEIIIIDGIQIHPEVVIYCENDESKYYLYSKKSDKVIRVSLYDFYEHHGTPVTLPQVLTGLEEFSYTVTFQFKIKTSKKFMLTEELLNILCTNIEIGKAIVKSISYD